MKTVPRVALIVMILIACIGCDQVTKSLAGRALAGAEPVRYLGGAVTLEYARNPGGFLSLGAGLSEHLRLGLFVMLTGAGLVLFLAWIVRADHLPTVQVAGFALILAGGAGNLIDRLCFGAVRDFVALAVGGLRTGIFNVADVAIVAGAVLALSAARKRPKRTEGHPES